MPNITFNSSEDLLSYEIGDIDGHDDGVDDLDAVEDELLMSDDGKCSTECVISFYLIVNLICLLRNNVGGACSSQ